MERRLAAGLVAIASVGVLGCPYEAPVEPAGTPLALQGADVGIWRCTSREGGEQADLSIGRSDASTYLLSLRGTEPRSDNDPDDDPPLVLYAKPRRVAGREVWVLSEAYPTRPNKFFYLPAGAPPPPPGGSPPPRSGRPRAGGAAAPRRSQPRRRQGEAAGRVLRRPHPLPPPRLRKAGGRSEPEPTRDARVASLCAI